ncbi:hypothetical protein [Amnibacterium kyonggiense]|uniref:Putative repeat protein (TIGR01451 family) n=1 Tax=Amnibacterium kyonggiense TaxID=595671 RepID=A0A4R7FPV1_9MICO|nr:hypothetical protein [Amnibacterium kyonggiense]TDS79743.1 putative repeat protein (TIGR01451 family) [Amnibacterium kyonggiense]
MIPTAVAKRMRFTPLALTTVLLSAGLLSLSVTGTLSGFTAQITNGANTVTTGSLVLQEGVGSNATTFTCTSADGASITTNSSTCSTINTFGGTGSQTMVPGQTVTQSVTFKNAGTIPASTFTLQPTACSQSAVTTPAGSATDLCSKLSVVVTQSGATGSVYSGTLAGFTANQTLTTLAAGASTTFTFAVTLASGAGNSYQGLQASVPMTWTLNS